MIIKRFRAVVSVLRNAALGGGLYPTTSQFGPNFFIGNNPGSDGTYMSLRAGRGDPEFERLYQPESMAAAGEPGK